MVLAIGALELQERVALQKSIQLLVCSTTSVLVNADSARLTRLHLCSKQMRIEIAIKTLPTFCDL